MHRNEPVADSGVISGWKAQWAALRRLPAGQRFQIRHHQHRRARAGKPAWQRALALMLVPLLVAVGVVLMFVPGPAILFLFVAGALLAAHSWRAACALDAGELWLRSAAHAVGCWWRARSTPGKAPLLLGAALLVAGTGAVALRWLVGP